MKNSNFKLDILYCITHGFAARLIMQTGLIQSLVDSGSRVGIISISSNDPNLQYLKKNYNVSLFEYNQKNPTLVHFYKTIRNYLYEDLKNNIVFFCQNKRRLETKKLVFVRKLVFTSLYLFNQLLNRVSIFQTLFLQIESFLLESKKEKHLLINIDPKIVISTYPVSFYEGRILKNSNSLNIRTVIHLLSWDNILTKGRFISLANHYIVWGDIMASELIEKYCVSSDNIYRCGVPHFDIHHDTKKEKAEKLTKVPPKSINKYLFFAMSASIYAPREIDIIEWLANKIEENLFGDRLDLVIRPHPENIMASYSDKTWIERLVQLKSERIKLDLPSLYESDMPYSIKNEDMFRMSELIGNSSICLNSGSTMSIDALMVGVPVIITSFDADSEIPYCFSVKRSRDFPHLKKLYSLNGISVVTNYNELVNEIKVYLENPLHKIKERENTRFLECGENDGHATKRVMDSIIMLTNNQ